MSCSTSNSPIDITDKKSGVCSLKCKYMFKYNDSSTTINNKGDYLLLSYDKPSTDPVIYNSVPYYVEEMRIYSPSLHSYSGSKADAELIIVHTNDYNTKLLVCVPIVSTTNQNGPLETVISSASKFANAVNKTTFITNTINLNNMVPQKKMYIYSGTLPYLPCDGDNDIIAFNKNDGASISISRNSLKLLNGIIKTNSIETKSNTYFVNNDGPQSISAEASNDIYIDCKPISDEGESIGISDNDSGSMDDVKTPFGEMFSKINYKTMVESPVFQVIMSILGAYLIYKFFFFIMNKTKSDEINRAPLQSSIFKSIRSKIPSIRKPEVS